LAVFFLPINIFYTDLLLKLDFTADGTLDASSF